jgi:hypothetical protein
MAETLELKDIANKLGELEAALAAAAKLYGLEAKRAVLREKEAVSGSGDFWNDAQKAQGHLKELNDLKKRGPLDPKARVEDQGALGGPDAGDTGAPSSSNLRPSKKTSALDFELKLAGPTTSWTSSASTPG